MAHACLAEEKKKRQPRYAGCFIKSVDLILVRRWNKSSPGSPAKAARVEEEPLNHHVL
jgi:hypothetical protein